MREIIEYAVLVNMPLYSSVLYLYSQVFDFKKCLVLNKFITFILSMSLFDAYVKFSINTELQDLYKIFGAIIMLTLIYKLNIITSSLTYLITYIIWAIINVSAILLLDPFGISLEQIINNTKCSFIAAMVLFPIILFIGFILDKLDLRLRWFAKRELTSIFGSYWRKNEKFFIPFTFVTSLIIFFSSVFTFNYVDSKQPMNPVYYFVFSIITCVGFSIPYFKLISDYDLLNSKNKNLEKMYNMCEIELEKCKNAKIS